MLSPQPSVPPAMTRAVVAPPAPPGRLERGFLETIQYAESRHVSFFQQPLEAARAFSGSRRIQMRGPRADRGSSSQRSSMSDGQAGGRMENGDAARTGDLWRRAARPLQQLGVVAALTRERA
jgi:hypothetical protein